MTRRVLRKPPPPAGRVPWAMKTPVPVARARRRTAGEKARVAAAHARHRDGAPQGTALTYQGARDLAKIPVPREPRQKTRPPEEDIITRVVVDGKTGDRYVPGQEPAASRRPRRRRRRRWCSIHLRYGCKLHDEKRSA